MKYNEKKGEKNEQIYEVLLSRNTKHEPRMVSHNLLGQGKKGNRLIDLTNREE